VKAVYFLTDECFDDVYGPDDRKIIENRVEIVAHLDAKRYASSSQIWTGVEVIMASWGMVPIDEEFLRRFPDVRVILYGAGSIRYFATETMWQRGIRVTSAAAANGVPVAEYALSQILFSLKHGWRQARDLRASRKVPPSRRPPGNYQSTVGLLALGMVGKKLAELLRPFDLKLIGYDPYAPVEVARENHVTLVSLDEVFASADVISCHLPSLDKTAGMLQERHFAAMKVDATFINSGRGQVVDEPGFISVLSRRPDLTAILDVTHPEPPAPDSPFYTLPNVVLTPHIAGSMGRECRRMGRMMSEELALYLADKPMLYEINSTQAALRA
jgi:phosphoglycerate dehydrogenase-like enzyme